MRRLNNNEYLIRKATWEETPKGKMCRPLMLEYDHQGYFLNCVPEDEVDIFESDEGIFVLYYNEDLSYAGIQYFGVSYNDNFFVDDFCFTQDITSEDLLMHLIDMMG